MPAQHFPGHRKSTTAHDHADRKDCPAISKLGGIQHQHHLLILISPSSARSSATMGQSRRVHPDLGAFSHSCVLHPDTTRASVEIPLVLAGTIPTRRDALICVIPADPDSAIPALHRTRPHTCGLLKWPKVVDTSCFHCDNRSGQGVFVLLLVDLFSLVFSDPQHEQITHFCTEGSAHSKLKTGREAWNVADQRREHRGSHLPIGLPCCSFSLLNDDCSEAIVRLSLEAKTANPTRKSHPARQSQTNRSPAWA